MESIDILEDPRHALPDNRAFNLAEYSQKLFSMFGGEEENICLQFDNSLIGVVLDRFGLGVTIHKADESSFIINFDAFISPTLLGWIFEFGNKAKVVGPKSLIDQLREKAADCIGQYTNQRI